MFLMAMAICNLDRHLHRRRKRGGGGGGGGGRGGQ